MNYFIHMLLYLLRCEEYFSVIICTFYIIDCVQGLEFFHCNFYIIGLEKNHFGPKSILLCTNRKWGFLQCSKLICQSCLELRVTKLTRQFAIESIYSRHPLRKNLSLVCQEKILQRCLPLTAWCPVGRYTSLKINKSLPL